MKHECGHPDGRENVPDVDLHLRFEPGTGRSRSSGEAARLCVPIPELVVAVHAGGERAEPEPLRAPARRVTLQDPPAGLVVEAPRIVGSLQPLRIRGVENEPGRPLRVGRGEERAHRAPLGLPEQDGTLGGGCVEDRPDVVEQLLERSEREDPVREPCAPPVEDDDAGERPEPVDEVGVPGPPLVLLEVREVAGREQEIDRSVARHLVGDVELAAPRPFRLGLHGRSLPP
jgi:hypothetical protein